MNNIFLTLLVFLGTQGYGHQSHALSLKIKHHPFPFPNIPNKASASAPVTRVFFGLFYTVTEWMAGGHRLESERTVGVEIGQRNLEALRTMGRLDPCGTASGVNGQVEFHGRSSDIQVCIEEAREYPCHWCRSRSFVGDIGEGEGIVFDFEGQGMRLMIIALCSGEQQQGDKDAVHENREKMKHRKVE